MANNYTQSSFELRDLTEAEVEWLEALETLAEKTSETWDIMEFHSEWQELLGPLVDNADFDWSWQFEWHGNHVLIYSDESGGLDLMALAMQAFLARFRPTQALGISWASTCSKMRPGEFSGGAMFITAHGESFTHVDMWLDKQQKNFDTLMAWMGDKYT